MNTKINLLLVASVITVLAVMIVPNAAIAEPNQNVTNVTQSMRK